MATSSFGISYKSYAAGVASASTVFTIAWCVYCLRSNVKPEKKSPRRKRRWRWESIRRKKQSDGTNRIDGCHDVASDDETVESSQQPNNNVDDSEKQQGHFSDSNESDDDSTHEKSGLCIGSIFGLDVGGTLSKLVYFQRTPLEKGAQNQSNPDLVSIREEVENDESIYSSNSISERFMSDAMGSFLESSDSLDKPSSPAHTHIPQKKMSRLKRVRSMFDIAKAKIEQRAQVLDRFYNLISRLEDHDSGVKENYLSFNSPSLGGEFHFIRFETRYMTKAMKLIREYSLHLNIEQMGATGGGAHKYAHSFEKNLGIQMAAKGELDSLVIGMQFVLSDVDGECYTFEPNEDFSKRHKPAPATKATESPKERPDSIVNEHKDISKEEASKVVGSERENRKERCTDEKSWARKIARDLWTRKVKRDVVAKSDSYPYMIVIIGTGVSVLRVDGLGKHERISGSTIGGGTYWGLCRLLTDVEDYESVLNLAERGKSSKVDMMVGDIYGKKVDALEKLGLTADVVASSFGKLSAKSEPAAGLKQEDIARALLLMVTNNIGQVAYLNAQIHNTKHIYFVGNFLRHNAISQQRLAYAINYWSKGKMEALFLEHEGYLGALGAYLIHQGLPSCKAKIPKDSKSTVGKPRSMSI